MVDLALVGDHDEGVVAAEQEREQLPEQPMQKGQTQGDANCG
jgi:hypothetical protein